MTGLFQDTSFWVLIAFCCFVALVWKKASTGLKQALDNRITNVQKQLDDAKKLREEAQALFDQFEAQRQSADKTAREIVDNALALAKSIRDQAQEEASRIVTRHTAMVETHVKQAEIQAIADVRREASEMTMKMVRDLIEQNLDDAVRGKLFTQSLNGLDKPLN